MHCAKNGQGPQGRSYCGRAWCAWIPLTKGQAVADKVQKGAQVENVEVEGSLPQELTEVVHAVE